MKKSMVLVAMVAVLSLASAACKSSDDSNATASGTAGTASTELGRGVTADTITLGVTYLDLSALKDVLPGLNHGDYEVSMNALAEVINEGGGINGRKLELVFAEVDPLQPASNEAACLKLTEDTDVFAVVATGLNHSGVKCVIDHATPLVGGTQTSEDLASATGPWFTPEASTASAAEKTIGGVLQTGDLKDKKVGVVALPEDGPVAEAAAQQLRDAGIDVAGVAVGSPDVADVSNARAEMQTYAERFKAEGVDTVVVIGDQFVLFTSALSQTDYRPQLISTYTNIVRGFLVSATDLSVLNGLIAGGTPDEQIAFAEPPAQDCVDRIQSVVPDLEVPPPGGDVGTFVSVTTSCRVMDLFAAIATKAGDTLNSDTFREAGNTLGLLELPMVGGPSDFSAEHTDGNPPYFLSRWDPAKEELVTDPEPIG
jgi:hypothetical protein